MLSLDIIIPNVLRYEYNQFNDYNYEKLFWISIMSCYFVQKVYTVQYILHV